jgi:hypothetical protein
MAFVADYDDYSIQSCAFQVIVKNMGANFGHFVWHMIATYDHGVKREFPIEFLLQLICQRNVGQTSCWTNGLYNIFLQNLEHLDKEVADWLHEWQEQFARYLFPFEGKPCFGKQPNNAAE